MNPLRPVSISLLNGIKSPFPIINSVIEGTQDGQVYQNSDQYTFIMHKAGFGWLHPNDPDISPRLLEVLFREHLPDYFHIYNPPDDVAEYFAGHPKYNVRLRNRVQLRYLSGNEVLENNDGTFLINEIDYLNYDLCEKFNLSLDSRFWRDRLDFIGRAMGVLATDPQGNPASICYAAAVADNTAEVDILTLEPFRNKGLAKSVLKAFVNQCLRKSIIPNWDCFEDNQASLNTALSLKFEIIKRYQFLSIYQIR